MNVARGVLRGTHLPALKERLTTMLKAVDAAEKAMKPRGKAALDLAKSLQAAATELQNAGAAVA